MGSIKNYHADLIYHLFAHMNLMDNVSNLYDREYIERIKYLKLRMNKKHYLEEKLYDLTDKYLNNFEKLSMLNFIPFYAGNLADLKNMLLLHGYFNEEDKREFLIPFFEIAEKEVSEFYYEYWTKETEKFSVIAGEFYQYWQANINNFKSLCDSFNLDPMVYLSLSLTRNGRGIITDKGPAVVVSMPRNEEEFKNSFIQGVHEMTHMITDKLIEEDISMKDNTHGFSESLVILTDFYLFRKYNENLFIEYCKKFSIYDCSEDKAREKYSIPDELYKKWTNYYFLCDTYL